MILSGKVRVLLTLIGALNAARLITVARPLISETLAELLTAADTGGGVAVLLQGGPARSTSPTRQEPQSRETDAEVLGEETVEDGVDQGVEVGDEEGPDEVMRAQEELGVFGGSLAVDVDEEHDDGDGKPHDQDDEDVEQEDSDDPDVLPQAELIVLSEGRLTGRMDYVLQGELPDVALTHVDLGDVRGRRPPPARLQQLVEDPLVVIDEKTHGQNASEEDGGQCEANGEADGVGLGEDQGADVERGFLVEPEGDGQEEDGGEGPGGGGEEGGQARCQLGAVRRLDDAVVTVHGDQSQGPQQDETTHELKHGRSSFSQ